MSLVWSVSLVGPLRPLREPGSDPLWVRVLPVSPLFVGLNLQHVEKQPAGIVS